MNITNLLEYNNKLRLQLNEDNKKYYEEQARLAKEKESGPEIYVESTDDTDNKDIEE